MNEAISISSNECLQITGFGQSGNRWLETPIKFLLLVTNNFDVLAF